MLGLQKTTTNPQQLWKRLEKESVLSKEQWRQAMTIARNEDRHPAEVVLGTPSSTPERILEVLADYYEVPFVLLREKVISPYVITLIPKEVAEEHAVVIFKKIGTTIHVATTNPENPQTIEFIRKKTGLTPQVFLTTPDDLERALKRYPSEITTEFARIIERSTNEARAIHDTAEKMAQYVPIVTMVNTIIERALNQKASDIHLEPKGNVVAIRFRIDGLLKNIVELPLDVQPPLVTRLKLLANLKIDEHRAPQDGRFNFSMNDRGVAIRVSAIPTLNGTKMVLRLLDTKETRFTLRGLGFNDRDFTVLRDQSAKPHGLLLVTGPTGSGKTTTLYTLLRMLNKEEVNICTIEDPIEYGLEGINQTQVNAPAGLTFANGLRSLLRQDPNVIMVGEIRDRDTADIAVNAAMTGHLVLSTLHTNTASLALQRLIEMGVEPYLAASVTNVIVGQRLVRRVCRHCRSVVRLPKKMLEDYRSSIDIDGMFARFKQLGLVPGMRSIDDITLAYGQGCAKCQETGYRGRVGIYETLSMNDAVHRAVLNDPSATSIEHSALQQGLLTMRDDGILKAFQGLTTLHEVLRATK